MAVVDRRRTLRRCPGRAGAAAGARPEGRHGDGLRHPAVRAVRLRVVQADGRRAGRGRRRAATAHRPAARPHPPAHAERGGTRVRVRHRRARRAHLVPDRPAAQRPDQGRTRHPAHPGPRRRRVRRRRVAGPAQGRAPVPGSVPDPDRAAADRGRPGRHGARRRDARPRRAVRPHRDVQAGTAYVVLDGEPTPTRARASYWTDDHITTLAHEYGWLRVVDGDWTEGGAA